MGEDGKGAVVLAAVCLLGWASVTNYTNHAPLLPILMDELGFDPARAGLLSTAFFLTIAAVFTPAGILCDRVGAKSIGTIGLLVTFLSNGALGFSRGFADLVVIKVVGGIGCGMAFIAGVRYVTLAFPPGGVHLAQGLYGGFVQLGGGTPLFLLPWLNEWLGWRWAFILSAGLVGASLVVWQTLAPDVAAALPRSGLRPALRSARVWLFGLVHTATFGLSVLIGMWITVFLVNDLGFSLVSAGSIGSLILAAGVVSRPAGGVLLHRRWIGADRLITGCLLVATAGLVLLAYPARPVFVAVVSIAGLGAALNFPYAAVMNGAAAAVGSAPGAAVGIVSSAALLGIALGSPALGAAYSATGDFTLGFAALAVGCFLILLAHRARPVGGPGRDAPD